MLVSYIHIHVCVCLSLSLCIYIYIYIYMRAGAGEAPGGRDEEVRARGRLRAARPGATTDIVMYCIRLHIEMYQSIYLSLPPSPSINSYIYIYTYIDKQLNT